MQKFTAIILAAGKGTRMKSPLPKVLHPVAGEPMILHGIRACREAGVSDIRVIVGYGKDLVEQVVRPAGAEVFVQSQQLGTADAVKSAQIDSIEGDVLILNGDHPLIRGKDLKVFIEEFREMRADLAVVSAELEEPGDFGRIVKHKGHLRAIVEAKDAGSDTLAIKEVNTGLYLVKSDVLQQFLPKIKPLNVQKEFYITDLVALSFDAGKRVTVIKGGPHMAFGVNSQQELSKSSKDIFRKKAQSLMDEGVIIIDPETTYIEESVSVDSAVVIYPGVHLRGKTTVASFCVFEPGCIIFDSELGQHVEVKAYSYIEGAKVGANCTIGPFARIRPETELAEDVKIGNFVETKKAKLAKGVKASHLTYLGDAEVGEGTNIGCGTITCNYAIDHKKYKTIIGKNVFVGSDTQFVAPITVGDNAVIGSGSTITKDIPAQALAVARGHQLIKENYVKKKES